MDKYLRKNHMRNTCNVKCKQLKFTFYRKKTTKKSLSKFTYYGKHPESQLMQ